MCQKCRLREQEERDITKRTALLLSLCPRLHVPAVSPVYFLPSGSFGLSPAARHWQRQSCPGSLLHWQSLPRFLSSTLSFPGCLLCAACQPVAHVAPYWKEAQKYFDLKLSWQHQCLDQKDSGGGWGGQMVLPRDFCADMMNHSHIHFHCSGHKHLFCADCWTMSIKGI